MKPLNTNLFKPLFAILAVALSCVCMWGCSFEDESHKEWAYRGDKKVVGFLDDSLVIVGDARRWYEVSDEDGDIVGLGAWGHHTLYLYNYRVQENGPRWLDSLDNGFENDFEYFRGQLSDSVIWGGGNPNYYDFQNDISFWKIGEKPKKIKIERLFEGCSHKIFAEKMHEWNDGKIIVLGGTSVIDSLDPYRYIKNALVTYDSNKAYCQYAILDTTARTITYKRLDKDLEWIKQCDDVRAWGNDVYCLLRKKENLSVLLSVNKIVVDSIEMDDVEKYAVYPAVFAGDMLYLGDYICFLNNEKMQKYPNVRTYLREIKFIDSKNNVVSY